MDPKLRLYECVPLYCKDKCETLDDCFGSTEFSQLYYKNFLDPGSPAYSPKNICEKSNPVKVMDFDAFNGFPVNQIYILILYFRYGVKVNLKESSKEMQFAAKWYPMILLLARRQK